MFNPNISFSTFIKVYDNTLTEQFCKNVCEKLDNDDRKKLGVFNKYKETDSNFKTSLDLHISRLPEWKDQDDIFFTTISQFLKQYREDIQTSTNGKFFYGDVDDYFSDTGYQVKVYKPDGHYDWHSDYGIHDYSGVRALTFIWYLNEDFDEGETEFFNGEKIIPKTGRLLIFPANWIYVHRGCTVKTKNKYIATGWYCHQNPETKNMIDALINKDN
tara:strand:- start:128 stop:775 length:648 start_codon:yes stop_codon:yes gene_type:complete